MPVRHLVIVCELATFTPCHFIFAVHSTSHLFPSPRNHCVQIEYSPIFNKPSYKHMQAYKQARALLLQTVPPRASIRVGPARPPTSEAVKLAFQSSPSSPRTSASPRAVSGQHTQPSASHQPTISSVPSTFAATLYASFRFVLPRVGPRLSIPRALRNTVHSRLYTTRRSNTSHNPSPHLSYCGSVQLIFSTTNKSTNHKHTTKHHNYIILLTDDDI